MSIVCSRAGCAREGTWGCSTCRVCFCEVHVLIHHPSDNRICHYCRSYMHAIVQTEAAQTPETSPAEPQPEFRVFFCTQCKIFAAVPPTVQWYPCSRCHLNAFPCQVIFQGMTCPMCQQVCRSSGEFTGHIRSCTHNDA